MKKELTNKPLPVEIVFHPSWWNKHTGITFDEDFFYHPLKRVESERRMEKELHERFGEFGLGEDHNQDLPVIGAVHNAAGYIMSEILGCEIRYVADQAPQVISPKREDFDVDVEGAMNTAPMLRLYKLIEALKSRYGYVCGDINWGGVLNVALDLKGDAMLTDMMLYPEESEKYFRDIASVIEKFVRFIYVQTDSTSISVNRIVKHIQPDIFLHSECTHTMISEDLYETFLLPIDLKWSETLSPFGIHYCGRDPHRYANEFAKIPNLAFLDLGWGGDVKLLREKLPNTFFSIRLDPVTINNTENDQLEKIIRKLINDSGNPMLTGLCCINMDANTEDSKIRTIYKTVEAIKKDLIL
jgi:uroporphyrinogen-III decarboxylase